MGVIKKQGIKTTAIIYVGALVGYVNSMVLFPQYLGKEYYGLLQTLLSATLILAQFARIGLPNLTIKFFPKFRADGQGHNGFFMFITAMSAIGLILFIGAYLLIEDTFVGWFAEKSPLFVQYSYLLFPLTICYVFFDTYSAYSRSILKAFVPSLIREVLVRVLITICILFYVLQLVELTGFLHLVTLIYGVIVLVLVVYFKYLKQLNFKWKKSFITKPFAKEMTNFTSYAFLGGSAAMLINRIDVIMISSITGLQNAAVYAVAGSISTILYIPTRALNQISEPVISRAWKEKNMLEIKSVYQKTSIVQFLAGVFAFLGIWANIDNIFALILPDYAEGKYVILFISLAKLFDMITGCNSAIIANSKHYRFILYSNVCLVFIAIATNLLLIPKYGIVGAAIATAISVFLFNFAKLVFILIKVKIHPFTLKTVVLLMIVAVVYLSCLLIPSFNQEDSLIHLMLDILVRSVYISITFGGLVYFLNINEQINDIINGILKKVGLKS